MSWFQYLLQANLYLALFYGFFVLLLRNETFFNLNRIYLISTGILSFLIPVIEFDWVKSLFITEQVRQTAETITVAIYYNLPMVVISAKAQHSWLIADWIYLIYISGLVVFICRFLFRVFSLYKNLLLNFPGNRAHSFFGKIMIAEDLEGKETILEHEKVHVRQWHSLDVLIFELIAIFNWFNPFVYAYKKALRYIHEFIADDVAARTQLTKENYSILLISNVFEVPAQQLSNNFFNRSLLKRRIIMLHKRKSGKVSLLKYGLSVPLFIIILIFSSATSKIEKYAERIDDISLNTVRINDAVSKLRVEYDKTPVTPAHTDVQKETEPSSESPVESAEEDVMIVLPAVILQEENVLAADTNTVVAMESVQILPAFPGGARGWVEYLMNNYNYPAAAREHSISGTMLLSFIVERNGSLTDIKIIRDPLGFGTAEEGVRLLTTSPKWTPGIQNGLKVRVAYTQPITLKLN